MLQSIYFSKNTKNSAKDTKLGRLISKVKKGHYNFIGEAHEAKC